MRLPVWSLLTVGFLIGCSQAPRGVKLDFKSLEFPITFEQRAEMYSTVEIPEAIRQAWHNKEVHTFGYMLPLTADKQVKEFMLVHDLWTCCYGKTPDLNQVIYVTTDKPTVFHQEAVLVEGVMTTQLDRHNDAIRSLYQIKASKIRKAP